LRRLLAVFCLLPICISVVIHGQARPTASRLADIQVGAGFSTAKPDYGNGPFNGYNIYGDVDFRRHYGIALDFHNVKDPHSIMYERTYEIGGRYMWHFGPLTPYFKGMYGRGVFNFPPYPLPAPQNIPMANLAYNLLTPGGGVDFAVHPRINVRADFEYQHWFARPGLPNGLTPYVFSVGAAYHLPPGRLRKGHF
jgi:hypothetical protein